MAVRRPPDQVGSIGAGFRGRTGAYQMIMCTPGMVFVAVSNWNITGAQPAFRDVGVDGFARAAPTWDVARTAAAGVDVVIDDREAIFEADGIDVICDATGAVDVGATVTLEAFEPAKHVVTMNAKLDGTVGPLLTHRARVPRGWCSPESTVQKDVTLAYDEVQLSAGQLIDKVRLEQTVTS